MKNTPSIINARRLAARQLEAQAPGLLLLIMGVLAVVLHSLQ